MLAGEASVCASCHKPGSKEAKLAEQMAKFLSDLESAGSGSSDALARARVAVHSLNLDAMKRAAETAAQDTKPDEN